MRTCSHLVARLIPIVILLLLPAACLGGTPTPAPPTATPRPLPAVQGRIAFLSDRSGTRELWLIGANGQHETVLLPKQQLDIPPVWSPDGSQIAYGVNQGGKTALGVLMVNPDGTPGANRVLTQEPQDGDNSSPAWSPDAKALAFQSSRSGAAQVYTVPVAGGAATALPGQPALAGFPAWSPDGKTLVFAGGSATAKRELWTAPLGGGPAAQITNIGGDVARPQWTHDGQAILFLARAAGNTTFNISEIRPDGSGQRALTAGAYEDLGPVLSPDGAWIAFFSDRSTDSSGTAQSQNNEIYVMPRDATSVTNVTETPAGDTDPSWAPDNVHLVFASGRAGGYRLYVSGRDGANPAPLTSGTGEYGDTFPVWSP
ncbi:MAG: hypothetical protein M3Z04_12045 [Chloroflexota bacterium]|nr:hypothetical protein [Chloroflexota bacterium]